MKNAITFLLLITAVTLHAQVPVTGKSFRIMNSDSTHGEINATEYLTSAGKYRYKQNGVWYYRASTADIAAAATLASNGLMKTGNTIRLGGTLTQNTSILGGGFNLTIEPTNLNLNSTTATTMASSSLSITTIGGPLTLSAGSALILSGAPPTNNALTTLLGRNSSTGEVEERTVASITALTATQVGYGGAGNTLTGEAAFNYDNVSNTLTVDNIISNSATTLSLVGLVNTDISAIGDVLLQPNDDIILNAVDDIILTDVPVTNNALTTLLGRNSSTGNVEERTVASITGAPAGSDTQVQFNNAGAFGADADFTYSSGSNQIDLTANMTIQGSQILIGPASNETFYSQLGITVTNATGYSIGSSTTDINVSTTGGGNDVGISAGGSLLLNGTTLSTSGIIYSSIYTPTYTSILNLTSGTAIEPSIYTRVGNTVTLTGSVQATITAASQANIGVNLPVSSDFVDAGDATGNWTTSNNVSDATGGFVIAHIANNVLNIQFNAPTIAGGSYNIYYTVQYIIK